MPSPRSLVSSFCQLVCMGVLAAGAVALVLLATVGPASAQSSPVPDDAELRLVDDGFEFTEGPLWHDGRLLFSDIPANRVYEWTPEAGTSVFLEPSGRANGLAADSAGRLLLAQHDGKVGRLTEAGGVEPLVEEYEGKRLNSPNDLTVAADGSIYFTDPPYGVDKAERELDISGVYRLAPDGTLTLLIDDLDYPNGLAFSPDESRFYVNDSGETFIRVYDVTAAGTLTNGRRFATPEADAAGTTDGMAMDAEGHLYTTGPGGVWIYAPDGTRLDRVSVPQAPTNVAFGGPDNRTLYITARSAVYRLPVRVPGAK